MLCLYNGRNETCLWWMEWKKLWNTQNWNWNETLSKICPFALSLRDRNVKFTWVFKQVLGLNWAIFWYLKSHILIIISSLLNKNIKLLSVNYKLSNYSAILCYFNYNLTFLFDFVSNLSIFLKYQSELSV